MAYTINYVASTGWPISVSKGTAAACIANVASVMGSWIAGSGTISIFIQGSAVPVNGGAAGTIANGTGGGNTYSTLIGKLAGTVNLDEYPNNIKTTAFATLPGYPSASNSDNPYNGVQDAFATYQVWDAVRQGNSWDGTAQLSPESITIVTDGVGGVHWDATADRNAPNTSGDCGLWGLIGHESTHWWGSRAMAPTGADITGLYSFNGVGSRSLVQNSSRYFSLDNGVTNWAFLNDGSGDYNGYSNSQNPGSLLAFNHSLVTSVNQIFRFQEVQLISAHGIPMTKVGLQAAGLVTNTAAPTVTGTPGAGNTLTAHNGTWTGDTAKGGITQGSFKWYRNDVQIATGGTYLQQSADNGQQLKIGETASNWVGSDEAFSTPINVPSSGGRRFRMDLETGIKPALLMAGAAIIIRNPKITRRGLILPKRSRITRH